MNGSFFDTNVLVYAVDEDEPEKRDKAQRLFEEEFGARRGVLSTQVLQEFYWVATRKLDRPLTPERAEARVRDLSRLPVVRVDVTMLLAAISRGRLMGFSLWDSLIVEAALTAGADRLFTEDLQDGQVIEGMRVENPFLP